MAHRQVDYKRRKLIVSGLQYRLAALNFLYLLVVVLTVVIAVSIPFIGRLDDPSRAFTERADAARGLMVVYAAAWIAVPVAVLLCLLHSIVVSHRIAGPLYRFKQSFRELAAGNLGLVVRIRQADYLTDETEVINRMIEELAEKVQAIHKSWARASTTLPDLALAVERNDAREAAIACGKLGAELDDLGSKIRAFEIPGARAFETPARVPASVPTSA
jgi:nitrogen fixation/metabolism regulation signal transduction histidine kinase